MKRSLHLLLLALAATSFSFSRASADDELKTITVGAWNIEWLGSPNTRTGIAKNIAQKPEDIAEYIDIADVDILALSEIGDSDTNQNDDERKSDELQAALDKLNERDGHDWDYMLLAKKDKRDRSQLTAVAWNKEQVELEKGPFRIGVIDDSDEFNLWDRQPHGVKFQLKEGKNDLVLIPVHMKSNRGGSSKTSRQRKLEAQALVQTLSTVKNEFKDQDIVILGDFNVLSANEPACEAYTAAGFWDLNGSDEPTTWNGPAPFDRIFVPEGQEEFDGSYQYIVDSGLSSEDHKKKLSDHYMVTTTVTVDEDQDDDSDQ